MALGKFQAVMWPVNLQVLCAEGVCVADAVGCYSEREAGCCGIWKLGPMPKKQEAPRCYWVPFDGSTNAFGYQLSEI